MFTIFHVTAPEHLSSPLVVCEVRVTLSVVFFVAFCRSLFFFFWSLHSLSFVDLRLWYLQTFLMTMKPDLTIKVKCLVIYLEHLKYNPSQEESVQTPYQDIIPMYVPLLYSYFHLQK